MKVRRYCTQATIDAMKRDAVEVTPTGALSFNVVTLYTTDWYVVPDGDPRVDTVEEVIRYTVPHVVDGEGQPVVFEATRAEYDAL